MRIDLKRYLELKDYFLELGMHRKREAVESEFQKCPFVPDAQVRRQVLTILRAVNDARKAAGFQQLSKWCVRLERRSVKVFEVGKME